MLPASSCHSTKQPIVSKSSRGVSSPGGIVCSRLAAIENHRQCVCQHAIDHQLVPSQQQAIEQRRRRMGKDKHSTGSSRGGGIIPQTTSSRNKRRKSSLSTNFKTEVPASLYSDNIGQDGANASTPSSLLLTTTSNSRSSSIGSLKVNQNERKRRKDRMVRSLL